MCGDDGKKVTPVPISNTEVKLLSADCSEGFPFVRVGRCRAFFCLQFYSAIAQLTPPFHGGNTGSNPVRTISHSAIAQLVVAHDC